MVERRGQMAEMAKELSTPELEFLFSEGRDRYFAPGEYLITEGESTDFVFDLMDGTVALARNGQDGRRQILSFLGARQFLGAASTPSYPNLATALTPVTAIAYPRVALDKALCSSSGFSVQFRRILTCILESAHDHIYIIGQRSAVERVASFLLYLRDTQASFTSNGPRDKSDHIDLPMTRLDIADFLGLTIETVSRAFSTLKKSKVIGFTDSHACKILNIDLIRELGGRDDFTRNRGSA